MTRRQPYGRSDRVEHNSPIPDVSFVRNERLSPDIQGLIQGAPDVAIVVVSSETAAQLERKINSYVKHGGKLVVVAFPDQRAIRVHLPDGTARRLVSTGVASGFQR